MPSRPRREEQPHHKAARQLARFLARARNDASLSQQQLAQLAGVSIGTVRALETFRTTDPSFFTVLAITNALHLTMPEVLAELTDPGITAPPSGLPSSKPARARTATTGSSGLGRGALESS